jgi:hypothetical protein
MNVATALPRCALRMRAAQPCSWMQSQQLAHASPGCDGRHDVVSRCHEHSSKVLECTKTRLISTGERLKRSLRDTISFN